MNERFQQAKRVAERAVLGAAISFAGSPLATVEASEKPINIPKEGEAIVPEGCVLASDVIVEGKPSMNKDALRGTLVVFQRDAHVYAPYGASGLCGSTPEEVASITQKLHDRQIERGCTANKGCMGVDTQYVTKGEFHMVEATGTCTSDIQAQPGETHTLPKGSVGKGDPKDVADNLEHTGLVFVATEEVTLTFPDGANIQIIKDCHEKAGEFRGTIIERFQKELKETGCTYETTGKPCEEVDVVYLPGGQQSMVFDLPATYARNLKGNYISR